MSGFEIAGVVLGSIPLLISALEHYSDGVSTIKSMRKYEPVFEYIHATFVTNLTIYRNSLEELLSPLALSDLQLYRLLEEKDGTAWEEPDLMSSLKQRLEHSYLPFKSSIKQLNKKVVLFKQKLQLDEEFRPPWVSPNGSIDVKQRESFFKNPINRIRGGFNSEKYQQLLASIEADIDRIAKLTSTTIALEPIRLHRKRNTDSQYWASFQACVERLYQSFSTQWSSQCSCGCLHEANLRLELRSQSTEQATTFKFLLSFDSNSTASKQPWVWRTVEVEPLGDLAHTHTSKSKTAPRVVIQAPNDIQSAWKHCVKTAPAIIDLCRALERSPPPSACIGILHEVAFRHHIHSVKFPQPQDKNLKRTTLQDILDANAGKGFDIREKCFLALILASAVLQLHDTPWLRESWTMQDVFFLNHDQIPLLSNQPYVSKSFAPAHHPLPSSPYLKTKQHIIIKNPTIFALGVALLQLSHAKHLDAFATPDDLDPQGNRTFWTDYMIADRLADGLLTRELPNFANATRRCIHCNFEGTVYSLNDEGFRERFYQGVVVPLQQDYEYAQAPSGLT